MDALANVAMDGRTLRLLIKSCQESAQRETDLFTSAQYSLIQSSLQDSLKAFHETSRQALNEKYVEHEKKPALREQTIQRKY